MIPEPVKENVRELPAGATDIEHVLNREVIPVLRKVREALNALLAGASAAAEPDMVAASGTLADDVGLVIVTQPSLSLALPSASAFSVDGGHRITIRNKYSSGAGDTTITPDGADTIEGGASYLIAGDGNFITLVSVPLVDGDPATDWAVVG